MQPFRYITEVASTKTFSPSISKVLSIIPEAFSNGIEEEKPEQPPPTTPMRRPAGTGLCCPMISFTLETALDVSETGGVFFTSGTFGFTSGTLVVVVAIRISLALKYLHYSRGQQAAGSGINSGPWPTFVLPVGCPTAPGRFSAAPLANGSIMLALGRSSRSRIVGSDPHPRRGGVAQRACKLSRWPMNWTWTPLMVGLAIVWGVFTVGLILLLIYRSTLTMHEEESLYLDDASQHMQQEQTELLVKVNRLTVPVWVAGAGSGVLLLVLAGMFIYQGLNAVQ